MWQRPCKREAQKPTPARCLQGHKGLDQPWFVGRLASPSTFGRTGFIGTSLLVGPAREMVVVLLSNRAHSSWSWSDPDIRRVAVRNAVA
jgi:CubicO group peptidase (beta-lactamase class C family)